MVLLALYACRFRLFEIPAVRVTVILYKSFIAAFTSSGHRISAI